MTTNKPEDYQDFRAECEKILTEQAKQLNWPRREYIAPSSPDFGAMLFDEPEVVAVVARRFFGLPRPEFTVFGRGLPVGEQLIRLSDYEALQADRDQQYDMKVKAREQRDAATAKLKALQAECKLLREHLQNLIDQTTPLEPVPGNPMWSRRIQLDEVIAERDQLRAECENLRKDAERYRWITSHDEWAEHVEYAICEDGRKPVIDAAIDAAMETTK